MNGLYFRVNLKLEKWSICILTVQSRMGVASKAPARTSHQWWRLSQMREIAQYSAPAVHANRATCVVRGRPTHRRPRQYWKPIMIYGKRFESDVSKKYENLRTNIVGELVMGTANRTPQLSKFKTLHTNSLCAVLIIQYIKIVNLFSLKFKNTIIVLH